MVTQADLVYAKRLRILRLSNDIKQDQAAELLGLASQQHYSKLENGHCTFSDEMIHTICTKFKFSYKEFSDLSVPFSLRISL